MFTFIKQHRLVAVLILINILAVVIVVGAVVYNNMKTATININVAPNEAIIELNGHRYDNFGSHDVLPGNYHVKISMEGMQTKEFDITMESNGFTRIETYLLDANGGFDYYIKNQDDELTLEDVANDEASKAFIAKYNKIVSIADVLPLEYYDRDDQANPIGIYIEQDLGVCEDDLVCLSVYGGEQHKDIVADLIREAGYNPDDYRIIYVSESEYVTE